MSIWDGFRGRLGLASFLDPSKAKFLGSKNPSQEKTDEAELDGAEWTSNSERTMRALLHLLKGVNKLKKQQPPPPQLEVQVRKAVDLVKELLPTLSVPKYTYAKNSYVTFSTVRKYFLDIWHLLLFNLELMDSMKQQKHAFEAIAFIITRREFDVHHMQLQDFSHTRQMAKEELVILHRYRVLLFNTQAFVNIKLSEAFQNPQTPPSFPFILFCARILAVNFFRLPGISHPIISAAALSSDALHDLEVLLEKVQQEPSVTTESQFNAYPHESYTSKAYGASTSTEPEHDSASKEELLEEAEKQEEGGHIMRDDAPEHAVGDGQSMRRYSLSQSRCLWIVSQLEGSNGSKEDPAGDALARLKSLSSWQAFHSTLLAWRPDDEDEKLRNSPSRWLSVLAIRDRLFMTFVHEWLELITEATHVDGSGIIRWEGVRGYVAFLLAFLHEMAFQKHYNKPLIDCSIAFLSIDPNLINVFIKLSLSHTSAHDIYAVIGKTIAFLLIFMPRIIYS